MDPVSITLNDDNFLTWKKQALRAMKAKKLDKFIEERNCGGMPHKFETSEDELVGKIRKEYKNWEQRDQVVYRWLLASLSPNLRIQMVEGTEHAFQIWNNINTYFDQKECEELHKRIQILENEKALLIERLRNLAEDCQKISIENDALEKELVEKYGPESIRDLLP